MHKDINRKTMGNQSNISLLKANYYLRVYNGSSRLASFKEGKISLLINQVLPKYTKDHKIRIVKSLNVFSCNSIFDFYQIFIP